MQAIPIKKDTVSIKKSFAAQVMVTVIIPTYNAGERFAQLLEGLKNQTIRPCQIIVVDSQSRDGTEKLAEKNNCRVFVVDRADFGHGKTRNLAASMSHTEFLLFLTQDAVAANENMIAELIKPMLSNDNIAMCYGRQLPNPDAHVLECLARQFNYPPISILKTRDQLDEIGLKTFFCSNSCSAIRWSAFEKLGRFMEKAVTNEDMLFAAKAILQGYSIYYAAEAKVYHSHNYKLSAIFRRYFKIGRFFTNNKWLLSYAPLRGYGLGILRFGIQRFWRQRSVLNIFALLVDLAIKTVACNLGSCYQRLSKMKEAWMGQLLIPQAKEDLS